MFIAEMFIKFEMFVWVEYFLQMTSIPDGVAIILLKENLRSLYLVLGRDEIHREIEYLDRVYGQVVVSDVKKVVEKVVEKNEVIINEEVAEEVINEIKEVVVETKQKVGKPRRTVIIEPPEKYKRIIPDENDRCCGTLGNSNRCSFNRVVNTRFCSRHQGQVAEE
jgi:hypothetical protein